MTSSRTEGGTEKGGAFALLWAVKHDDCSISLASMIFMSEV